MGAVLAVPTCLAQLACCCGSAACGLCCQSCPTCRNSTSTRIMYGIMLFLWTIVCFILLAPSVQHQLADGWANKFICDQNGTNSLIPNVPNAGVDCSKVAGYSGVYRVCFAVACFFFLMMVIMFGVRSSKDFRSGIQNGFWFWKYAIIIGICVGAFYIPGNDFSTVWMYIGMIGGFGFILVQLILLIDLAHSWAENWIGKFEDTDNKVYYFGVIFVTVMCYIAAIVAVVLLYVFYTKTEGCPLNKFFISFNMILCVILSVVAVLPKVQERQPRSGLMQSSIISLYVIYVTWSSLSNQPDSDGQCYPSFMGASTSGKSVTASGIVGLIIWFACILWSTIRNSTNSNVTKLTGGGEKTTLAESKGAPDAEGAKVYDDEEDQVTYSYSFFHMMMLLGTLYVMMTITNWLNPESAGQGVENIAISKPSAWVKISSSWVCVLLYVWTLIAPVIFKDREFSN
ncbi:probable serine incorporator isoform X2 [Paramacrobiotus metropolitanus]|uniref:probable serine incorporator isoform X2 n=1 Tax=Paramacrobiotus metropolitanus TaxID=2943436 RepID=UPI0024455FE2|nr:probable serine incorporator isoform X2 [Paramacrobiotus metropolitanus]